MSEIITEYIRACNNDDEKRDEQACGLIDKLANLHESQFDRLINPNYHTSFLSLLLSYIERISYFDSSRMSYDTYCRYASFINVSPRKESEYLANQKKEVEEDHKGCKSMANMMIGISETISAPEFRVALIMLTLCVFKDEGSITTKQRDFATNLFQSLQIK